MTKIKNYEQDSTINDEDKVIGTDGVSGVNLGRTKNYTIASLVNYINTQLDPISGGGTTNTIPIWVDDEELGDSPMSLYSGRILVAQGTDFEAYNAAFKNVEVLDDVVIGQDNEDTLTVNSVAQFNETVTVSGLSRLADVRITGTLADNADEVGTSGQILSSTGTGVQWIDNDNVSGTLNTIAMFTPDGTSVGDSPITFDNVDTINVTSDFRTNNNTTIGSDSSDSLIIFASIVVSDYADDSAAETGGIQLGQLYRTGNVLKIRIE